MLRFLWPGAFSCLWVLILFRHALYFVPKFYKLVPVNFNLSQCLFVEEEFCWIFHGNAHILPIFVLLWTVFVIVAYSQMVIVTCLLVCLHCLLIYLLVRMLACMFLNSYKPIQEWNRHSWLSPMFPYIICMKLLKMCHFTHFSSVVACSPWEYCALC